jgi:hypothetical protein
MHRRRHALLVALPLAIALAACQPVDQGATMSTGQMMLEAQDAIDRIYTEMSILQGEIDSLRTELTRQDSLIRVMFNLQGNPLPPRPVIIPPG